MIRRLVLLILVLAHSLAFASEGAPGPDDGFRCDDALTRVPVPQEVIDFFSYVPGLQGVGISGDEVRLYSATPENYVFVDLSDFMARSLLPEHLTPIPPSYGHRRVVIVKTTSLVPSQGRRAVELLAAKTQLRSQLASVAGVIGVQTVGVHPKLWVHVANESALSQVPSEFAGFPVQILETEDFSTDSNPDGDHRKALKRELGGLYDFHLNPPTPGLMGFGIAATSDGKPALSIHVRTPDLVAEMPSSFNGVPVVVRVSGDVQLQAGLEPEPDGGSPQARMMPYLSRFLEKNRNTPGVLGAALSTGSILIYVSDLHTSILLPKFEGPVPIDPVIDISVHWIKD